ncbi:MAG: amidohydrolase family protein [Verrucomicrobiota bacterium]|jgi:cytosine/adenosine deaminase-related metal-dependent hydrolase
MILRARIVLPVSQPPIENGAVEITGGRIRAVGAWAPLEASGKARVVDLGEVILLPGLINAHCHLDYTDMAGLLPPPRNFTDWIHLMIEAKAQWEHPEYERSWRNGARMLLASGTTTVADIEAVPALLPAAWNATPLRVFSYLEMTGIRARRQPREVLQEALDTIASLRHARCRALLSPHAPYSTLPELLRLSARAARQKKLWLTTHVAESEPEFEMFVHGRGTLYDWLKRNERDMADCGLGSPIAHLARTGMLGERLLAVHANTLARGDAALLGQSGTPVAHCPRSHEYFRHPPFLWQRLVKAGVNLCLGTDSLATVRKGGRKLPDLSMFEEMRTLADREPDLPPMEILRMATINGARALGQAGRLGEFSPSALADLIAIPFTAKGSTAVDFVVQFSGPVSASMIGGQWAIEPR